MTAEPDGAGWPERYREALARLAAAPLEMDEEQMAAVLRLARDVAHGSERRAAPLATFLAGQYVASRQRHVNVSTALEEAQHLARALLPAERPE